MPKVSTKKEEQLLHNVKVSAYSRRTESLAYAVTLPGITERWIRKLINRPRGVIIGEFELGKAQVAAVQRIVEVELDPASFWYFFDGDAFARVQKSITTNRHRTPPPKNRSTTP